MVAISRKTKTSNVNSVITMNSQPGTILFTRKKGDTVKANMLSTCKPIDLFVSRIVGE